MHCYQHRETEAVAACRVCGRGVCPACAHEGAEGITCSDSCQKLGKDLHEMNLKALRMYSIGRAPPRVTPAMVVWLLPGLVFLCFGAVSSWLSGRIDTADALVMTLGLVFIVTTVWFHYQARNLRKERTDTTETRAP